jgi:DNA primase
VREQQRLPATPPDADPRLLRSGQDWATWLRGLQHSPPPGQPRSASDLDVAWAALTHLARRKGFAVERANCADADGFTTWRNRGIRIRPDASPAQAVIALAHQLSHVLLHGQIARLELSGTVPCTGIRKIEADSIAYLAAAHAGISTAAITFPHVTSWAGTDPRAHPAATIQAVTTRILTATSAITSQFDAVGIEPTEPLVPERDHTQIHQEAAQFFHGQLGDSWVPRYLNRRGLTAAVQETWQAGHAPAQWNALTLHLTALGHPEALIEATGLGRRSRRGTLIDTFRDRAMLPIRQTDGTIVAFIGRAAEHAAPDVPKYLNSPATSHYSKGETLFGLYEARAALANGARPVIVEGPLDAIAVSTAGDGRYAGLAPCGTALTACHVAVLARNADLRKVGVMVAFDPDDAGQRAAVRACHLLAPVTDKMTAVTLPAGQDPAQILATSGPEALTRTLAANAGPLPDLVTNAIISQWSPRLGYVEGQIGALHAAAPLIAALPPAHVARQVARLAAGLRLDHAIVTEAVTDALTALVSAQAEDTGPHATTRRAGLRGPPSAAIRPAHSDHPASGLKGAKAGTHTPPVHAPGRRAGADRGLTARRIRS